MIVFILGAIFGVLLAVGAAALCGIFIDEGEDGR
jgi:hypothetical protein